MKTKKELQKLSENIGNAIRIYHKAIFDNLKESGKEHGVEADWEEEDSEGVHLTTFDRHDFAITLAVDKVRFNAEKGDDGCIEAHICSEDGDGCDYWMTASEFGNDVDYLYDNIIW
jgi:hypothetical protein